jgi:hypothetical protein
VEDVLREFFEQNGFFFVPLGADRVARVFLSDIGELTIDLSCDGRPCMYVLFPVEHPSIALLLRGFWLCDPIRSIGDTMHFVGDGEKQIGFLIVLDKSRFRVDNLAEALTRILGAIVRLRQH